MTHSSIQNNSIKQGLLIYNPEDYEKNKWFASELLTKAAHHGLSLKLILRHELVLSIEENAGLTAFHLIRASSSEDTSLSKDAPSLEDVSSPTLVPLTDIDFVINRTRDSLIGTHFEKMGCRVFNNSTVTEICNHKGKTHQLINSRGIPSVGTFLGHVDYFHPAQLPFDYPVILKSVSGHGGSEVYRIENEIKLNECLALLPTKDFIIQEMCTSPGTDIRVFALGDKIIAAVKRFCPTSFKSNYSLGGSATAYTLKPHEKELVKRILSLLPFDFIGIDFILNESGDFLFNEIEDVVGTRTLYLNYPELDIVDLFLDYIASSLATSSSK